MPRARPEQMNGEEASWRPTAATFSHSIVTSFDPSQELIWTGDAQGKVESLFAASGLQDRYTAYKGHTAGPVKALLVDEKGIFSIGGDSMKCANRRGLTAWNLYADGEGKGKRYPPSTVYSAMAFSSARAADLVVAAISEGGIGKQPDLQMVNASTGTILRKGRFLYPSFCPRRLIGGW